MGQPYMASDVIVFGSQGSSSHFATDSYAELERKAPEARERVNEILRECFLAFNSELNSLSTAEKAALDPWIYDQLDKPETLLKPPPMSQTNAVIESITFYLHQLVDWIIYSYQNTEGSVVETIGVCSGMLPAVLASAFPSADSVEFPEFAGNGLRLAFRIGLRTALFCHRQSEGKSAEPWALTIRGCSAGHLQAKLSEYSHQAASPNVPIRISAILTSDLVSLSGDSRSLDEFKKTLPQSITVRYPHIHGYYHGGHAMGGIIAEVIEDVERRRISFPTWELLKTPLRSSTTGESLQPVQPLLKTVLEHVFVHTVDWRRAWDQLHRDRLSTGRNPTTRVVLLGPNTGSLRLASRSSELRPEFVTTTPVATPAHNPDDIAIVGISANFPGGKGLQNFWDTLKNGISTVTEIPSERFDASLYHHPTDSGSHLGRWMTAKHGNFLENPFEFDNAFFNISPREAKSMDPQQRLLLHGAAEALENAGYAPDSTPSFRRESFGVFVGVATGDYVDNLRTSPDVYYSPGTLRAFLSGKISYAFGFKGPSVVVDTACSSSMVAVYHACRALQNGDCLSAVAGGVNVISSPDMYLGLARAHFLSPTGQCKPFDEAADGYCRSEGCGVVVLKRLSAAMAEGDRIHGVIRGIEVNQCGDAKSITHPDHRTQAELLRKLMKYAGVNESMISVIEAHGTGTQAGDLEETRSLRSVFSSVRSADNPLYLCSVKGSVGHAEAASGMAALAKLVMMLKHRQVPPQASLANLNRRLDLVLDDYVVVPTQVMPWTVPERTRRLALVNNFGAAGSNAALLLEDAPAPYQRRLNIPKRSCHVLNISAKTNSALELLRSQFMTFIKSAPVGLDLINLCYSTNARRIEHDAVRLSVIGKDPDEILARLRDSQSVARRQSGPQKTIFLFSGQGSIHIRMGAELLNTNPRFQNTVRTCDTILAVHGFPKTWPYMAGYSRHEEKPDAKGEIVVEQCACFVLEYALALVWMHWGVTPDLVVGHSLGEYAAFAIAGALELSDALLLVARRADAMARLCQGDASGMMLCRLSPKTVQDLLSGHPEFRSLRIACENGPENTVVGGSKAELEALAGLCKSTNVKATMVDVPFAFHTFAMDPMMESFSHQLRSVRLKSPAIPVGSGLRGRILSLDEPIEPSYFAEHCRETLQFHRLTDDIVATYSGADKAVALIEMGPSAATLSITKWAFHPASSVSLASLQPKESPWFTLSAALRVLYLQGYTIAWRNVYEGTDAAFIDGLPCYPFENTNFIVPYIEHSTVGLPKLLNASEGQPSGLGFEFLNQIIQRGDFTAEFQADMATITPFIKAHVVGEIPLCPASVYIELALEAVESQGKSPHPGFRTLTDIGFKNPLISTDATTPVLNITLQADETRPHDRNAFTTSSLEHGAHCTGIITMSPAPLIENLAARKTAYVRRQKLAVFAQDSHPLETFSAKTIYQIIFPRVVSYSPPLETLKHLQMSPAGLEGYGVFKLPPLHRGQQMVCHPALVDTLLHVAGFIANATTDAGTAYICSSIDYVVVPTKTSHLHAQQLEAYCSLVDVGHSVIGDAYALDARGEVVAWVEGMTFKKLSLRSFKSQLSRLAASPKRLLEKNTIPQSHTKGINRPQSGVKPLGRPLKTNTDAREDRVSKLHSIIREVCGLDSAVPLSSETMLSSLGIDSLLQTELGEILGQRLPLSENSEIDIETCQTIQDLEKVIETTTTSTVSWPSTPSEEFEAPGLPGLGFAASSDTETPITTSPQATPSGDLEDVFRSVFGLDISGISKNTITLGSLGVDSLGSVELIEELEERFGLESLNGQDSISDLTIQGLESLVQAAIAGAAVSKGLNSEDLATLTQVDVSSRHSERRQPTPEAPRIPTRDFPTPLGKHNPGNISLYLFHDGSGKCGMYSRLDVPGYNIFGVYSLDFELLDPGIRTMEDLAALYIEKAGLDSRDDSGEIALGGWSFGGVLAFEVARQLKKATKQRGRGSAIRRVVLIDSPFPIGHEPLPQAVISRVVDQMRVANTENRENLKAQFTRHARMLQGYNPEEGRADVRVSCAMVHCERPVDTDATSGVFYPWLTDNDFRRSCAEAWPRLSGGQVPILSLDCHHFDVFGPSNIGKAARCVQRALGDI